MNEFPFMNDVVASNKTFSLNSTEAAGGLFVTFVDTW